MFQARSVWSREIDRMCCWSGDIATAAAAETAKSAFSNLTVGCDFHDRRSRTDQLLFWYLEPSHTLLSLSHRRRQMAPSSSETSKSSTARPSSLYGMRPLNRTGSDVLHQFSISCSEAARLVKKSR